MLRGVREAVDEILPAHATLADRRSLFQSVMREYGHDLRVVYEQVARRSLASMRDLAEEDRPRYLSDMRPLDVVEDTFRGIARRNTVLMAAAVGAALGDLLPPREPQRRPAP